MITDAEATRKTGELVELMPLEWRGDSIKASDLGELRRRDDGKMLLKEIPSSGAERGGKTKA